MHDQQEGISMTYIRHTHLCYKVDMERISPNTFPRALVMEEAPLEDFFVFLDLMVPDSVPVFTSSSIEENFGSSSLFTADDITSTSNLAATDQSVHRPSDWSRDSWRSPDVSQEVSLTREEDLDLHEFISILFHRNQHIIPSVSCDVLTNFDRDQDLDGRTEPETDSSLRPVSSLSLGQLQNDPSLGRGRSSESGFQLNSRLRRVRKKLHRTLHQRFKARWAISFLAPSRQRQSLYVLFKRHLAAVSGSKQLSTPFKRESSEISTPIPPILRSSAHPFSITATRPKEKRTPNLKHAPVTSTQKDMFIHQRVKALCHSHRPFSESSPGALQTFKWSGNFCTITDERGLSDVTFPKHQCFWPSPSALSCLCIQLPIRCQLDLHSDTELDNVLDLFVCSGYVGEVA